MALERISAIALPPPLQRPSDTPRRAPAAGETIQLTVGDSLLDEVLASTADGLPLRLAGLGALARSLVPGDVLLVRVMSTTPRLELALFDTPSPGETAKPAPPPAMRADQLAQRQMNWRPPEAAALAASWRTMVLSQVATQVPRAPSPMAQEPAAVVEALPAATEVVVRNAREPATPGGPERWLFPAYAWGGLHVMLRLLDAEEDAPPPAPPRRRQGPMSLRIEVDVPGLGWLAAQVSLVAGGVALRFFIERDEAMPAVRQAMPHIAQALGRAGMRLVRCDVAHGLASPGTAHALEARGPQPAAHLLSDPLFRAAAEVAVALSSLVPSQGLGPVCR